MGPGPNDRRLSAYHIRKACEDSLRRLKTDHIDVYQMHHIDRYTPWEEIWQAMELLVQQGKVLYIGSSNFAGWDIATAQSVATARHSLGLVAEQSLYNLTARTVELEVIPACRHFGLGTDSLESTCRRVAWRRTEKDGKRAPCKARVFPSNRTVSSAAGSLRRIM